MHKIINNFTVLDKHAPFRKLQRIKATRSRYSVSQTFSLVDPFWLRKITTYPHTLGHVSTGFPRRNVPDFGRVFLMLKYTDITQNAYVQSWTVTEIMATEKCGLLAGPHTVSVSWQSHPFPSLSVVSYDGNSAHASHRTARVLPECAVSHVTSPLGFLMYSAWNPKDNYDMSASVFFSSI